MSDANPSRSAAPLVAVVLAAGASTRMGAPKALVQVRGVSFVQACRCQAHHAGADPCVIVQGATPLPSSLEQPLHCACGTRHAAAQLVSCAQWATGPQRSLLAGVTAALIAQPAASGVLVLTVDRPHIAPATLAALSRAHREHPTSVLQPAHAARDPHHADEALRSTARRGHPILWPASALDALQRALQADRTPRDVLHAPQAPPRRSVEVHDPAVLDNLDTPQSCARIAALTCHLAPR